MASLEHEKVVAGRDVKEAHFLQKMRAGIAKDKEQAQEIEAVLSTEESTTEGNEKAGIEAGERDSLQTIETALPLQRMNNAQMLQEVWRYGSNRGGGRVGGREDVRISPEGAMLQVLKSIQETLLRQKQEEILRRKYVGLVKQDFNKPLLLSCLAGDHDAVGVLINLGASLAATDECRRTGLHIAAQRGHTEVARVLLERGADANAGDECETTPLHLALQEGHLEIAEALLAKGADTNAQDMAYSTPLYLASQNGHMAIVKVLLEKDADPDGKKQRRHKVPLHAASEKGHLEVLRLLLDKGADVNARENYWVTPLDCAAKHGHLEIVKALLEKGATAGNCLCLAFQHGHIEIAKVQFEKGAGLHGSCYDTGFTPLHFATQLGSLEVVQIILEKFRYVNTEDKGGRTPLHLASQQGHLEIAEALLEKGADPNGIEHYPRSPKPLHLASQNGHVAIVKALLEKGAIVDATSSSSYYTPLDYACQYGHLGVVKVLLEHGAHTNRGASGRSLMSLASKHPEIQKLLREYGAHDGY